MAHRPLDQYFSNEGWFLHPSKKYRFYDSIADLVTQSLRGKLDICILISYTGDLDTKSNLGNSLLFVILET